MSIESAIQRGRAAAERQMTLTLHVYEPNGTTTDGNGLKVPAYTDHGTVAGKVQGLTAQGHDTATRYVDIGGVSRPVLEAGVHLPIAATVPAAGWGRGTGWEYVVDAVGPADDPALLNVRFLVGEVPLKSKATARRLTVVQL